MVWREKHREQRERDKNNTVYRQVIAIARTERERIAHTNRSIVL